MTEVPAKNHTLLADSGDVELSESVSVTETEVDNTPPDEENGKFTETFRAVPVSETNHPVQTYAELCALATSHRKIRSYSWLDRGDLIFKYKDTVLESLVDEPVFYISLAAYFGCRILMVLGISDSNDQYLTAVSSVGTVLSFMFVFTFTSQYSRYMSALQLALKNGGFIQDIVYQCRGSVTKDKMHLIIRYANAANFAAYTGLSDYHTVENFFVPSVKKYNLLTKPELKVLLSYDISNSGMSGCKVLISWISDVIHTCPASENPANGLNGVPMTLRENFSNQFFYVAFSTPFIYLHFTYACIVIYLPIFSFALARQVNSFGTGTLDFFNLLAVLFLCIFFLGLYKLSRDFQDPYGLDFVDIPIIEICNQTVVESFRIAAVIDAQEVNEKAKELRKLEDVDGKDDGYGELGPGLWDTEQLANADEESSRASREVSGGFSIMTHKMKRKLRKKVAALKMGSKAMPSFM